MSQKGEKYARRMERRVDKLEQDVAAITTEQTTQGVRISAVAVSYTHLTLPTNREV